MHKRLCSGDVTGIFRSKEEDEEKLKAAQIL